MVQKILADLSSRGGGLGYLGIVVCALFLFAGACAHHQNPRVETVPLSEDSQERLTELRETLTRTVNELAQSVSRDHGGSSVPPLERFTVSVSDGGESIGIEMEPIIVIGDGNGCVKDPPGISCECPCP